jgi:hypothetical protein
MGLGYAWREALQGNFENAFNGVWVSDDLLAAQSAENDNLSKIIARQNADGLVNDAQAQAMYSQMSPNTDSSSYWNSSGPSPYQTFQDTLSEEAGSIGQFGSGAINRVLGLGFKIIPWQVYLAGFVLAAIWLYPIWKPFAASMMKAKR